MTVEDYRRILSIVLEQCKVDGCKGCAFINVEEWEVQEIARTIGGRVSRNDYKWSG